MKPMIYVKQDADYKWNELSWIFDFSELDLYSLNLVRIKDIQSMRRSLSRMMGFAFVLSRLRRMLKEEYDVYNFFDISRFLWVDFLNRYPYKKKKAHADNFGD